MLFAREGFDRASMDRIAEAAGVSKATLYSHFADKEALFEGMVQARRGRFPVYEPGDVGDREAFVQTLEAFGRKLLGVLSDPELHAMKRLIVSHREASPALLAIVHRNGPRRMQEELAKVLAAGEAAGHVRLGDASMVADHLLSMWKGMGFVAQEMGVAGPRSEAEIAEHVRVCVGVVMRAFGV